MAKKYEKYKNSGVEWIGEIPEHWEVRRLRFLASIKTGGKDTINQQSEGKYPFFVRSQKIERINSYSYEGEAVLTAGDGAGVGKVFHYVNEKFDYHQRVYKFSDFKKIIGKFFFYYIENNFYKEILKFSAKSTVDSLRMPMIQNFIFSLPSINEQQKITSYLDKKSEEIDLFIKNKEELINSLEEEKKATITNAVTKGLDSNVRLKYSGADWLGNIPEHWETRRLKYLFKIRKRISGELGRDVLSITQRGVKIKDITSGAGQLSMDYRKYQIVEVGDFAMNHMDLLTGYVDISKYNGVTSPDYRVFSLTDKNSIDTYFLYLFQLCYFNKVFFAFGQGSSELGRWRFPADQFNVFLLPYPSKKEQLAIVAYLDEETNKIDDLKAKYRQEIDLIKEYKERLIYDVVTGKMSVLEH